MSLADQQRRFTLVLAGFVIWLDEEGYTSRFGDAWRSTDPLACPHCRMAHTYQDMLVANKRSKELKSKHCDRLAVDLILERKDGLKMTDAHWFTVGAYWESLSGRWGGRFGVRKEDYATELGWDAGHFEWAQADLNQPPATRI